MQPSFNLASLLRYAVEGLRRRWWLVLAAVLVWIVADNALFEMTTFDPYRLLFAARRAVSALMMAAVMAAIVDGGRPGRRGLPTMAKAYVKALPVILLAEAALVGPMVAAEQVFGLALDDPSPLVMGTVIGSILVVAVLLPLVVPAAVDGGRGPWAAVRLNWRLGDRRRWLLLGLALLLLICTTAIGLAAEAVLDFTNLDLGRPMAAFSLMFPFAAIMQAAAYLEFERTRPASADQVAGAFD